MNPNLLYDCIFVCVPVCMYAPFCSLSPVWLEPLYTDCRKKTRSDGCRYIDVCDLEHYLLRFLQSYKLVVCLYNYDIYMNGYIGLIFITNIFSMNQSSNQWPPPPINHFAFNKPIANSCIVHIIFILCLSNWKLYLLLVFKKGGGGGLLWSLNSSMMLIHSIYGGTW